MQCSVFIATSLDGFISRLDGSIDWLDNPGDPEIPMEEAGDMGFQSFFDSVDCMIMGRNTLDIVLKLGQWVYEGKRVVVLSHSLKEVPQKLIGKIELYGGPINELLESLESAGHKRAYVDGGSTIQSFIREKRITDMTITQIPILLGEGLPLFGKTSGDVHLVHKKTNTHSKGFVQSVYECRYL